MCPLAISLVVAANFAFAHANRKNLYNEYEDELYSKPEKKEDDNWPRASQNHLDEWDIEEEPVVDPSPEPEPEPTPKEVVPKKIIQKGPSKHRVLYSDGSIRKVDKDDNIIRYM